ncbi:MAG: ribosome assembly factor SBDS [Candidatus Nanohaloarchaea archaeon]|nr:ribosome assembly factor SBDS [Candidatus Nanohaloarchaea archaeon]
MDSEDAITVTYSNDHDFEILVDPDEAFAYRRGEIESFDRVLFVQEIFTDAAAAEKASMENIEDAFGTRNVVEAAEELFEQGEMALTTDQKNQLREEKRKQVVSIIARRAMNPQTNAPHPPQRIENAMDEAGVQVDAMRDAEEQVQEVLDAIRPKIPISMEEKEMAIRVPSKYSGKAYGKIQEMSSEVLEEEWGNDAFMARVRIPAGVSTTLMETLEEMTSGEVEVTDI